MIHGLLEFVREQRTHRQRLTRPQPCHHLQPARASPFAALVPHLEEVASASPPALPQLLPHRAHLSLPAPRTALVGLFCLTLSTGGRDMAHESSQHAQVAAGSKRCWVLLTSPSVLVPPVLSLSQPGSITSHSPASDTAPKWGTHPMCGTATAAHPSLHPARCK